MRTHQRLSATVLAAVAAAAALAGCSSAGNGTATAASALAPAQPAPTSTLVPHWPVTVTAANGAVTIKGPPERIVSLDPTATEDLYAVGAGAQVVAVDQDSDFPPGVPATSLSGLTPDIDAIAKYNPSLVIAARNSNGLVSGLNRLGIPVLIEPGPATVARVYDQIVQIGQATGHDNQAHEVVTNMREEITDVVQQAGTKYQGLTAYWERSSGPYRSATSATLVGHVMEMFGLKNIADGDGAAYPVLSGSEIAATRPQIIFLADNDPADGGQTPATVAARPGWAGIPAVRDHEIIGLNDDLASGWGSRLPQLFQEIASALKSFKS